MEFWINKSSKGRNYGIFKESIKLEEYFLKLSPKFYTSLAEFRTANHRFPCEVLRWQNIELSERKCHLCDKQDVGDEMYYLLSAPFSPKKESSILNAITMPDQILSNPSIF